LSPAVQHRARALFAVMILWAVTALPAAAAGRLVDPAWLQLHRAEVLLLDASMTGQHRAGHIAGAVSADLYRHGADEPTPAAMQQRMQGWGVSSGKPIVVYDQGGDWMAARLFHDLYVHGVPAEQLFLLDGGLARWKAQGGAVTTEATPPARGNWQIGRLRLEERVQLPEFLAAGGNRERSVLLDALGPSHYYGQQKFFDRAGHVPGAVPVPSEDFFNPDKTFRSADDVRRLLRYHGIRAEQEVLNHCGGGGAAAVPWFALKFIAGHEKSRLFLGSQREWLRDDRSLPFWTYAAPQLLRESSWLAGWNQPMLRMFGVARLNIVDVRAEAAYAQGHLPFALSLPAATLRQHLGRPEALAALLGPAGVNPGHEVVLVSEQGLTADAALAFLAFEQLGHAQVSLLLDSVDDWALRGHELTRQPTRTGPPRGMDDFAVPTTRYPLRSPRPVLAADPAATRGEYAKIFVATGRHAPAAAPAGGPLVHLPAAELVAANGTPKPAAELWRLIDKAGVPRQAELVFMADDLADAAIGYFVFRLMGWPDLKVWQR
jgi:thiosulfate/3-mercaptopyruvate sulfurtransferase